MSREISLMAVLGTPSVSLERRMQQCSEKLGRVLLPAGWGGLGGVSYITLHKDGHLLAMGPSWAHNYHPQRPRAKTGQDEDEGCTCVAPLHE